MNNQYGNQSNPVSSNPNGIYTQNYQQPITNVSPNGGNKLPFIIIGASVIVALVIIFGFSFLGSKEKEKPGNSKREPEMNRTIMIYMVGSDLESSHGLASAELEHIVPSNIDLKNNNIILIAGGSKIWKNDFISPSNTSVYQLKETGFEKIKEQDLQNMGDGNTLQKFLNETYQEYPAKKYNLIFWDHGSGVQGLESDGIYGDMLSLVELDTALDNSPFNGDEKFDSILFINCLLGGIEIAGIVDDHADYMIATEEVSYAYPELDKFKFLEEIELDDDGFTFGKKFIDNLISDEKLDLISKMYNTPTTYSIIDLSKIKTVEENLDKFAKALNVSRDYYQIASIRSQSFQYGGDAKEFDSIDLYTFVSQLSTLAPSESQKLLNSLNDAILYNYALSDTSKGLSIYFPYNGNQYISKLMSGLSQLNARKNSDYLAFIQQFDLQRKTSGSYFMDVSKNQINTANNDYSMNLSDSQKESFGKASYLIFQKTSSGKYIPVYESSDVTLNGTKLKANFDGKIVALSTSKKNIPISVVKEGSQLYSAKVTVGENIEAKATLEYENGKGKVTYIVAEGGEEALPSMAILNASDYSTITFHNYQYPLIDKQGYFKKNWSEEGTNMNVNMDPIKDSLTMVNVAGSEDYYFAFCVTDLSNETTYSKLVQIK